MYRVSWPLSVYKVGDIYDPLFSGALHAEVPKRLDRGAHCAYKPSLRCLDYVSYDNLRDIYEGYPGPMTRRGATHMAASREHVLCRTRCCMPHAIRKANGHGMPLETSLSVIAVSIKTPWVGFHRHPSAFMPGFRLFVRF